MTPFKFRGFHKGKPVFFTFENVYGNKAGCPCVIVDKPADVVIGGEYVSIHTLENVTQFLGIRDAKGTEIYGGDVMKWENKADGNPFVVSTKNGQIYFNSQPAIWVLGCVFGTDGYNEYGMPETFKREGMIIIGNIFENPSLANKNRHA